MIPCEKCGLNPANAVYNLIPKKGNRIESRNLCTRCALSCDSWVKMHEPKDADGNPLGDAIFYRPWDHAERMGNTSLPLHKRFLARIARASAKRASVARAHVPLSGAELDAALERLGVTIPDALRARGTKS